MHIIRRATDADLPRIYELQDVNFRDMVFIEILGSVEEFVENTKYRIDHDREHLFVHEADGVVTGFVRFLKKPTDDWEALTWGKWINTLAYASVVLAFEKLSFPKLVFAVRMENKRVMHLYEKFDFRRTSQEFVAFRPHDYGGIKISSLQCFEITAEEFQERSEAMKKNALKVTFEP